MLDAVQAPYALSTPVVECVEDALQESQLALAETAVVHVIEERRRLIAALASYEFVEKIWPSDANFFLVRVSDSTAVMNRCAEHKVLLRHFGGTLANCIRITVGSENDNKQLLHALDTLVESV